MLTYDNCLPDRAATFTCVNSTVSFRVSSINIYKIDLPFTQTLACDQHHGLFIGFPNEKFLLNSDTSHPDLDHQSNGLFSQIRL